MLEIDPQLRVEIVKLRKSQTSISGISERTSTSMTDVKDILKEELGDQYASYSLKKSKRIFSKPEKKRIVDLRRKGNTLTAIKEHTSISVADINGILKEELGDQYDSYSLRKRRRIFSKQERKRIVALRRKGSSLEAIKNLTNLSMYNVQILLKEELGDEYSDYCHRYKKRWCKEDLELITELRNTGKNLKEIAKLTGFSNYFVKKILIVAGDEDLISPIGRVNNGLTREQVISRFEKWYYKFAREMKNRSPKVLGPLKKDAIETFLTLSEGQPQPAYKRDILMPVFVYSFFRAKGFNVTFSLLKRLSDPHCGGYTKKRWRQEKVRASRYEKIIDIID